MANCKHLYYKTDYLAANHIGGLCKRRWDTSIKCYRDGMEHICKGYEYAEKESKTVETPVQEVVVERVPETEPRIAQIYHAPVVNHVEEKHRGRPKKK
jgi:hypothetical protein